MRVALIAVLVGAASMNPSAATQAIQKRDAAIRAVLPPMGQSPTEAQKTQAQSLLTQFIDFQGMAEAALGKHWKQMSPAKRKELVDAFTTRLKAATLSQLDFYRSTQIAYAPAVVQGDRVKVPTSMVVQGEPTQVAYVMKPGKDGWQIEDIVIDEVSTIDNYRSSFARVINKEGVDGLIARLEKRRTTPADGGARKVAPAK